MPENKARETEPGRIWLHRISHEAEISHPLLESGFLSIGFSDLSSAEFLESVRGEGGRDELDRLFQEGWGRVPKSRFFLWRFAVKFQPGDWVIVPGRGVFSIYRVKARAGLASDLAGRALQNWHGETIEFRDGRPACSREGKDRLYDIGFQVQVEPVYLGISRAAYADGALASRLKYRGTNINADAGRLRESVLSALRAAQEGQPLHLHSQILEEAQPRLLALLQYQLNPDKFEALLAWYFRNLGAVVERSAKNEPDKRGDGDLIATFEPLRTIYYIQAKHHTGSTDEWAIEQISAYRDNRQESLIDEEYTQIPWVVSTAGTFSESAIKMAGENGVQLVTGPELAKMILETGIGSLDALDL